MNPGDPGKVRVILSENTYAQIAEAYLHWAMGECGKGWDYKKSD